MSRNKIICFAALSACATLFTDSTNAKDRKRSFEISAYDTYQSLPVNTVAAEKTAKVINKQFPGWVVTTDKLSGAFSDIYGVPVTISGNTNIDKAQACMMQQLKTSGVNNADWKMVSNVAARKADYVNFTETISGHPVVYSWLSFRFTKDGKLARVQMNNYGAPANNTRPSISANDAKNIALKDLTDASVNGAEISTDWSWYPVPSASGYELHPAWHFTVDARLQGSVPLDLTGYIDATNGVILERTNETKETTYDVTVKGMVYKNGTLLPPTLEALPDLGLYVDGDTTAQYTDATGKFSSSLMSIPSITSIPLVGRWSKVIDSVTGTIPVYADTILTPGTTFTYPAILPYNDGHINAYYHVNRVHNFMKGYFPAFTKLDISMPTNVDLTSGSCNAFYGKSKINFYKAGSGCNSFAEIGDIIYHEYGHGISDLFYKNVTGGTTIKNGSLNEACSDVWAMSITRDPVLGANAFVGYTGFIRRYDMMPQVYPVDLETNLSVADVHKNGQIIAGTWWDVGVNLGSIDSMTRLFTDVYYDVPDGAAGKEGTVYQTILIDALMADDDNANLLDGTPHYNQIVSAFAKHGIYLVGDAKLTHTELTHKTPNTPITVTAGLSVTNSKYFHDLTMYYRLNGAGSWFPVTMANSSMTFTATIPAQPQATVVEYYFIVHDGLNTPVAFFPVTCNPALPSNQTTIPYQFGVGIHAVEGNDFEATSAGWKIGSNKGDDATGGLWHQGTPVKNATFNSFPATDHTNGTGKCLITGTGTGSYFGAGVAGGTSTVLTPLFDIAGFAAPVVEYYRWFSNEQGYSNFKNDPWIVKVRGSASSPWTTVENTYQADNNWRRRIFRSSTYLPLGTTQVQLMFVASDSIISSWDSNGQSTSVGGVDDFFIYDMANTLETPLLPAVEADIFPNPADDRIQVNFSASCTGSISVYDMLGKKVSEVSVYQNNTSYIIDTKAFQAGQYNMVIQTNSSIQSKKIVVIHG